MQKDDEIHVWEFPPESSYIGVDSEFQRHVFEKAVAKKGTLRATAIFLNDTSTAYGIRSRYGGCNVHDWKDGKMENGKRRQVLIPLWVVLEIIKLASDSEEERERTLSAFEKQVIIAYLANF